MSCFEARLGWLGVVLYLGCGVEFGLVAGDDDGVVCVVCVWGGEGIVWRLVYGMCLVRTWQWFVKVHF